MKRRYGVIGVFLVFLLVPTLVLSEMSKIDPMLSRLKQRGDQQEIAKRKGILKQGPSGGELLVGTFVRFQGDLSGVEALGGKIRSVVGDIATVDIPLSAIDAIARLPNVIYIEAAKEAKPQLNLSVPETGADTLRSGIPPKWRGNTGRNVIIGIVDSGIDLSHSDFKDPSGKTRVLFLWDQTATTGTPPSDFTFGNECTKAMIDAGDCLETDTTGHGTHVAGIAVGNGSATGNGKPAFSYTGMAPEADLIIVKRGLSQSDVSDGIAYIQAKAAAFGKPSVINVSLGSSMGPHDGTSSFTQRVDQASGKGKIIVLSAGNEQDDSIHASGTVAQGGSTTVQFTIPSNADEEVMDLWYPGTDQIGISISKGTTCTTPVLNPNTAQSFDTPCGLIDIISGDINPNNNDREIIVTLSNGANPLAKGAWRFTLSGIEVTKGRFDAWIPGEAQFTTHIDRWITLSDMATTTQGITVGSYVTGICWFGLDGQLDCDFFSNPKGALSSFSGWGPRRTCSDPSKCPSDLLLKPEIAAPGQWITSAFSKNTRSPDPSLRDPDGVHIVMQGTSMSAPHVTGAVALLLQAAPTLTPAEIKEILTSTARSDSFTPPRPNIGWGFGKLDAKAAFAATPNPPPAVPTGIAPTTGNGAVILNWTGNTEFDLDGYNLYRSPTSGSGYTKLAALSYKATSFTDTGLTGGATYFYRIRAVDTKGQESEDSAEILATVGVGGGGAPPPPGGGTPAGDGGGGGCAIGSEGEKDWILPLVLLIPALFLFYRGYVRNRVRSSFIRSVSKKRG